MMDNKARIKLFKAVRMVQSRIFGDWFKKLQGTDGIFEFRVEENGKYYRVFSFWDNEDNESTLIVATHGLIKKTNKTPKHEIENALRIKNKYFEYKKR